MNGRRYIDNFSIMRFNTYSSIASYAEFLNFIILNSFLPILRSSQNHSIITNNNRVSQDSNK